MGLTEHILTRKYKRILQNSLVSSFLNYTVF
ncbi:palindromic element RPE3 domain-containing protein [Rickettsia felis]|nr:palindromic element RPE3 domain-containing protein [Rickettsia felis]MDE8611829.1 palindromic element RPE3 domain-containing protein [Rickettsia felis]